MASVSSTQGPLGQGQVTGRGGDYLGQLLNDGQLLVSVEGVGVGEHLYADVGVVAVDVRQAVGGKLMDERGGVLPEHRDVRHTLDDHDGGRQVDGELVFVGEGADGGVHVDHGHSCGSCPRFPQVAPVEREISRSRGETPFHHVNM
jgi:hypothetical protein